jgi:prephenate dehydrogenase
MRIALLGLGLIGGSIARALSDRASDGRRDEIVAWSPTGEGPASALRDGTIDAAPPTPTEAIEGADLVILAGPAPIVLDQLDALAGPWRGALTPSAVVTDVASSKVAIGVRAAALGLRFVGGHPMAGRETSGYASADPDLFVDRPWVVVPGAADDAAVGRVEALARAVGARPMRLDADVHDAAVAAISHVPLVVAASLVEAVAGSGADVPDGWTVASQLAAGGWRDMTRLARGDVAMGAGMVSTNPGPVADGIRAIIDVLETWLRDLDTDGRPDPDAVERHLRVARQRLESMPR